MSVGLNEAFFRTTRRILLPSCATSSSVSNACSLRALSSPASPSGQQTEDDGNRGPSPSTLVMIALGACAVGAYVNIRNYRESEDAASVTVGKSIGKPVLGGPFQLVDHNKKAVSESDFKGRWLFIYFGFTYCPDICPNELMRMKEVLSLLDSNSSLNPKVEPIFITIDPARDGPEQLKTYLGDWHPRLIGLTGTQEQIDDVCKKYRVYYSKAQLGPDPMDYLIDHSVLFYLVDPDGQFVDYFAKNSTPQEIAARIAAYADDWKRK
eukprot:CAMPEP_0172194992 /NCGR_PEP_ID=MMETSP1050-20130122/25927_1 /TAXON_ID=233186 /ORGANISM="Cryptomonas curvata, Strain CCAP979/52" /LENGTH=265 /DNA_ID=CAMNT_0012870939 /DNA_START=9 /DNA_END=806 /DNA_ORIENTATION=-